MENSSTNLPVQFFIISTSEWETATQHSIEQNAKSPDISRWSSIFDFTDDFRSHIARSSAEYLDLSVIGNARTKSEINDLERMTIAIQ